MIMKTIRQIDLTWKPHAGISCLALIETLVRYGLSCPPTTRGRRWHGGNERLPSLQGWPDAGKMILLLRRIANAPTRGAKRFFPAEMATHLVPLGDECSGILGRTLSLWECHELARQLIAAGRVEDISAPTGEVESSHAAAAVLALSSVACSQREGSSPDSLPSIHDVPYTFLRCSAHG
jgi:hypothetical protein